MKRVLKIDPANFPKKINRSCGFKIKNIAYENLNEKKYQSKIHKKASQISKFLQDKGIDFSLQTNPLEEDKDKLINANKPDKEAVSEQDKVLEIDESDNDIQFKTPPNVKKIIIKSNGSSTPRNTRKKIVKKKKKVLKKS
ncbi:hypothetical protein Phum_PHUM411840 [Pediculus humanus corporis]|uniref:Uncharacterized protein n=1 Tax=Pediculus humanus subsp. corporis TaxID=121224 RepID=E0VS55_PEDHC|nr:uncharacterized protein Phum_PHUM411840 [Pediculus humanus corporis]EEB16211.1 hypothetical protein Phum_PHUM411840 [Pediculus humanus corporis]